MTRNRLPIKWFACLLLLLPMVSMAAGEHVLPPIALPLQQASPSAAAAAVDNSKTIVPSAANIAATNSNHPPVVGEPIASQELPAQESFSFGDAPNSLMFTTQQINAMKTVLRKYENASAGADETARAVDVELIEAPAIEEPSVYPVFYLTSIVYRDADDWMIWIASDNAAASKPAAIGSAKPNELVNAMPITTGTSASLMRITPKNNMGELKAIPVSSNQVNFVWKPTYIPAIKQRIVDKRFSPLDMVKHRLVASENARYDEASGSIHFTLRQNQSFSAAYFNVFEGKIASVANSKNSDELVDGSSMAYAIKEPIAPSSNSNIDAVLAAEQIKNK